MYFCTALCGVASLVSDGWSLGACMKLRDIIVKSIDGVRSRYLGYRKEQEAVYQDGADQWNTSLHALFGKHWHA